MDPILLIVLIFLVSFALGSLPNGLIIGKLFYGIDIRQAGSGNIGTTNAMRSLGKVGGAAVFLLDFGKGILSGFVALWMANAFLSTGVSAPVFPTVGDCLAVSFAGCILGHIYTPWLKFHGGKGIAVAVGCVFVVYGPIGACLLLAIFIVLVLTTKYVSVGSIAAASIAPFFALYYYWGDWFAIALIVLSACAIVFAHRGNIARLLAGNERKVGDKKKAKREEQG